MPRSALRLLWVPVLALACACEPRGGATAPETAAPPEAARQDPLPAAMGSASVADMFPEPVTLSAGHWEGPPYVAGAASRPTLTLLPRPFLPVGADSGSGYLVVLSASMGGSGSFRYLALMTRQGEKFQSSAVQPLGDRVQILELSLHDDLVEAVLEQAAAGDPLCCGGSTTHRRWRLAAGRLEPVEDLGGMVVFGHEAREIAACGGSAPLWLTDGTGGDLQATYEALRAAPYQPVFMVLRGVRGSAPAGEFATGYPGGFEVLAVRRAESEGFGCALDLGDAWFRALGVEPFWRLDISRDQLVLMRPDAGPQRFERVGEVSDGLEFEGAGEQGTSVRAVLEETRCVDPMSGSRYAYRARVTVGTETLSGCALAAADG